MSTPLTFLTGAVLGFHLRLPTTHPPNPLLPHHTSHASLIPATRTLTEHPFPAAAANSLSSPPPTPSTWGSDTAIHPATVSLLAASAFAALPVAICLAILGIWLVRVRKVAGAREALLRGRVVEHGLATGVLQQEIREVTETAIHQRVHAPKKVVRVISWGKRCHAIGLKFKTARVKSFRQAMVDGARVKDEECHGLLLQLEVVRGELELSKREIEMKEDECSESEKKLEESQKSCIDANKALQATEMHLVKAREEVQKTGKESQEKLETCRKSCIEKRDALQVSEKQLVAIRDDLQKSKQECAGAHQLLKESGQQRVNLQKQLEESCKSCVEKEDALAESKNELEQCRGEGEQKVRGLTEVKNKWSDAQRLLEKKSTECASLQDELKKTSKESEDLHKKFAEQVVEHGLATGALQKEYTSLQEKLKEITKECSGLSERVDLECAEHELTTLSLEEDLNSVQKKLKEKENLCITLREKLAQPCASCIAKNNALVSCNKKSDQDDQKMHVYEKLFVALRNQATEENDIRLKTERKLLDAEKEAQLVIAAHEKERLGLVENHQSQAIKSNKLLKDSKAAIKKLEKEKSSLSEKNEDLKTQLHDTTTQIEKSIQDAVDSERAKLESERKRLAKDGAVHQSRSDRLQKQLDLVKEENAKALDSLKEDLAKTKQELAAAVAKTSARVSANDALVKKLEALKASHAVAEDDLEALRDQDALEFKEKTGRSRNVSGSSSQTLVDEDLETRKEQVKDDSEEHGTISVRLPGSEYGKKIQLSKVEGAQIATPPLDNTSEDGAVTKSQSPVEYKAPPTTNADQAPPGCFEEIFKHDSADLDDALRQALTMPGRSQSAAAVDVLKSRTIFRQEQAPSSSRSQSVPVGSPVSPPGSDSGNGDSGAILNSAVVSPTDSPPLPGSRASSASDQIQPGRRRFKPVQLSGPYPYRDPRHEHDYLFTLDNLEASFAQRVAAPPRRTRSAPPAGDVAMNSWMTRMAWEWEAGLENESDAKIDAEWKEAGLYVDKQSTGTFYRMRDPE